MKLDKNEALRQLAESKSLFKRLFSHGSLEVEVYRPEKADLQQPHTRDEVYIIISGTGEFVLEGSSCSFGPGDFLFVPAGAVHRFEKFSADFVTWVLFYGPEGGEKAGFRER
jgi:mannose-6-phosphate isomerase-like protein (cupin superfamily)